MPFRQFLISRPGAQHLRQEEKDKPFTQYFEGMQISLDERDLDKTGLPLSKWKHLGLVPLIGTPTKAPKVPAKVLPEAYADGNTVILEGGLKPGDIDPKTGAEIPAPDGPADLSKSDPAADAAAARRAKLEQLMNAGEATSGAVEFNAWRATVVEANLLVGEVPTTKAALIQALAEAQATS